MEGDGDGDGLSCMSTGESPEKRLDEMEKRVSRKRTVRCLYRGEAGHKLKDCTVYSFQFVVLCIDRIGLHRV